MSSFLFPTLPEDSKKIKNEVEQTHSPLDPSTLSKFLNISSAEISPNMKNFIFSNSTEVAGEVKKASNCP